MSRTPGVDQLLAGRGRQCRLRILPNLFTAASAPLGQVVAEGATRWKSSTRTTTTRTTRGLTRGMTMTAAGAPLLAQTLRKDAEEEGALLLAARATVAPVA